MKKLAIITTTLVCTITCMAQISTLERTRVIAVPQENSVHVYDSLTNIEFFKEKSKNEISNGYYSEGKRSEENLAHLIGQRLFFYGDTAEMAKTSWLRFYKLESSKNKKKQLPIYFPYTDFLNNYFTFAGFSISEYGSNIFKLLHENEADTLYCRMDHFLRPDFWTVEGFYKKAKHDYLHKKYVLSKKFSYYEEKNWLYRLDNDQLAKDLPLNSVWECTDVTLKGYNTRFNHSIVILVFSNEEFGKHYIYLEKYNHVLKAQRDRRTLDLFTPKEEVDIIMAEKLAKYEVKGKSFVYKGKFRDFYHLYSSSNGQRYEEEIPMETEFLCTDVSFADNDSEKMIFKLHNDSCGDLFTYEYDFNRIFQSKEDYLKDKQREAQRKKNIIAKYGQRNGLLILEGKVHIGFTKAMCKEAWGEPDDINTSTGSWGVHEQWCYSNGSYLYFENGKLTSIQK